MPRTRHCQVPQAMKAASITVRRSERFKVTAYLECTMHLLGLLPLPGPSSFAPWLQLLGAAGSQPNMRKPALAMKVPQGNSAPFDTT